MRQSRNLFGRTLGALTLALAFVGCVGTPLPDPPSFSSLTSWSATPQPGTLRFVGRPGAAPASTTLRFTDPPAAGELVLSNADGSFGRILAAAPGDTVYVERVGAAEDTLLGAFLVSANGTLTEVPPGADGDDDGSPDAIDCAPADPLHGGQHCGTTCSVDSDCLAGQVCMGGVCTVGGCTAEVCNGVDDDCDGIVDDGDPGGGVACVPMTGMCGGTLTCNAAAPECVPNIMVDHETCGNGIDDDCNGLVDDGC
ncbi:MAG: hypothetical protein U0234_00155 [Sandaracinus sp.]